jgi:hypothetical protein
MYTFGSFLPPTLCLAFKIEFTMKYFVYVLMSLPLVAFINLQMTENRERENDF